MALTKWWIENLIVRISI